MSFEPTEKSHQYDSFDDLVKDAKHKYKHHHKGETEGLHYKVVVTKNTDGRSGRIKIERLEAPDNGAVYDDETLVVEDNKVVGRHVREEGSHNWIE